MPYLESSDQTDVTKDSVSKQSQSQEEEGEEMEDSPKPQRTAKSTRRQPLEKYGEVYTCSASSSNASNHSWYKQTIFIPCHVNL